MMKLVKFALALVVSCWMSTGLFAQKKAESEAAVVKFSFAEDATLKVGGKAKLLIEVLPKTGWHVYSALPSEDGAYQPTTLTWDITSRGFTAEAKLDEKGGLIEQFDEIMNGTVRFYKGTVVFEQALQLTEKEVILGGEFDYMACNDEKCIPLTADLKLETKAKE